MYGREGEAAKKEAAGIAYIPPDLCGEILYRLPSNDLLNCKLVSKEWLRLISSTEFIQKHLERSKSDYNHLRIVLPFDPDAHILNCGNNTTCSIPKINFAHCVVLGSCDGLVLYYNHFRRKIGAFNPCTGVIDERIPNRSIRNNMEAKLVFSWFGHHPSSTGEYYALLLANKFKDGIVFNVYTLSRNNINNITALSSSTLELDKIDPKMHGRQKIGTLLHGRLHWAADHIFPWNLVFGKCFIVVYDFETNQVAIMSPPVLCCYDAILGVVNGYLCAATVEKAVWMMKEYGVEESWTKYAGIEGYKDADFLLTPLAFCPNSSDHLIMSSNRFKTLTKYSFKERKRQTERDQNQNQIQIVKDYTKTTYTAKLCVACIDSLVSPTLLWKEGRKELV